MNSFIKISLGTFVAGTLLFTACRKEKEVDNDTTSAKDNNLAERLFDEVKRITDAAADGSLASSNMKSYQMRDTAILGCATVTHDTSASPRTLTIDYGTTNCLCGDGRERRGKIIVSYTGPYRTAGTVITHTFDNFFIEDHQVLGTKTVTNSGINTAGHTYFTIHVDGSVIKPASAGSGTITWVSDRVREWIEGESTLLNIADDKYSITGNASGTSAAGTSFTVSITSPLIISLSCIFETVPKPALVQGTLDITPSGKPVRTINYGSGACDNTATITVNGNTYTYTMW